jgi:hypothetical protein
MMVKRRVVGLMAGGLLALATALIAVSGSAFAAGATGPDLQAALDTTGGTAGHQAFPMAWNLADKQGGTDCANDPVKPAAGEVVWHFVLTSPSTNPDPAHLYAKFLTAGQLGPIAEYTRSGVIHWYVTTGADTLQGIWSDNAGGELNLSHICPNITLWTATPTIEITNTPYESVGGETGTPVITNTPYESVGGETGTPAATTAPPTSTLGGLVGSNGTPLMALLICVAFGSLGLMAVEVQRRRIRR